MNYPKCISQRSGCKVGWMTFATKADAEKASKIARAEGEEQAKMGYDFGYLSPGDITKVADGYEVVTP